MRLRKTNIFLSFEQETAMLLGKLAKKKKLSLAKLAHDLILNVLKNEEDHHLLELALKREPETNMVVTSHDDAWK